MKSIFFILFFITTMATTVFSQIKVTGKVVDNKKAPLEFANVVLQAADTLFGTSASDDGSFELRAIPHNYSLKISMLGYKNYEKEISLQSSVDLGEIQLEDLSTELKEIVVKGQRITRMPDRFIMNLANDQNVFGKDGKDILNTAPGVFIQERGGAISVNGKNGTKVYVNERPLHETGTDLVRYLQNLKAEDIMKIEVLPNAGSEYDASVTGGIIKITLKKQRDDGINGNVGTSYSLAPCEKDVSVFSPFYSMNYKINKLNLHAKINYNEINNLEQIIEEVNIWSLNKNTISNYDLPMKTKTRQILVGGVYDLSEKQSVGLEVYYSNNLRKIKSFANLTDFIDGNKTVVLSNYNGNNTNNYYSASANYMIRLDSLGSLFKILLDYVNYKADDKMNYYSEFQGSISYDSTYRSNMLTHNNLYAVTADLSYHFNNNTLLNGGLKQILNEMNNNILYEYQNEASWNEIGPFSSVNSFSENISTVYGLLFSRIQKIKYSLGLRCEYTNSSLWTNKTDRNKQHYFELFPSVNIMFPFGKDEKHSIILNYNRTIRRPTFNDLNPYRIPASEYSYIEGNPNLREALSNDCSIALRLFNRYNMTVGITDTKGAFDRVTMLDPFLPGALILRMDNVARHTNFYTNLGGSIKLARWWQIFFNINGRRDNIKVLNEKYSINVLSAYMVHTFLFPKDFILDLNTPYTTPYRESNMKVKMDPLMMYITLRKQFFNKHLTTSFFVNNLFNKYITRAYIDETDFQKRLQSQWSYREFGFSLSYNFQSGKKISGKQVETGAAEEKARMR